MPREKSIADLMREWRELLGLSRADAAARLGFKERTIETIEHGRTRVDDVFTRVALNKLIEDAKIGVDVLR